MNPLAIIFERSEFLPCPSLFPNRLGMGLFFLRFLFPSPSILSYTRLSSSDTYLFPPLFPPRRSGIRELLGSPEVVSEGFPLLVES